MKKTLKFPLFTVAALVALTACNPATTSNSAASGVAVASASDHIDASAPVDLTTEVQQVSYVMGYQLGTGIKPLKKNGGELDMKVLIAAMQEAIDGKKPRLNEEQGQKAVESFMKGMEEKMKKHAAETAAAGEKFLAENKSKDGIKTTASGLQYKIEKEGTGASPVIGDGVEVEYVGKLLDGTEFDSNKGKEPFRVPLDGKSVIPGWTEALQLAKEGGEYTWYIPAKLAYGENPLPNVPANSVLVFNVKVVKVIKDAAKANAAAQPAKKK